MSGLINKVKDALHSHKDNETTHDTGVHSSTTTGTHTGTHTGAGSHGLAGENRGIDGPASRTDGSHSHNVANKLDPTVDSDRDHSRNLGANPGRDAHSAAPGSHNTTGTHTTGTGLTGSHGSTGVSGTHGTHTTGTSLTGSHNTSTNHGPHDSNAANKLDPRVDSDRDNRAAGAYGSTGVSGTHGTHTAGTGLGSHGTHTTGTGLTGSHGTTHGTTGLGSHTTSSNAGPHDSNLANKVCIAIY
jgi:hypothetical protein